MQGRLASVNRSNTMAEVEWEHEAYFRARVEEHAWAKVIPMWAQPPGKSTIRARG